MIADERVAVLARLRKRRANLLRNRPMLVTSINDNRILIEALEELTTSTIKDKGTPNEKEKDKKN